VQKEEEIETKAWEKENWEKKEGDWSENNRTREKKIEKTLLCTRLHHHQ
jgi:hypothetical protein